MFHVLRLHPQQDLRKEIEAFCQNLNISASLVTCVGSLSKARLRMAGGAELIEREGPFEILSLVGIYCSDGGHFHCTLSDQKGNCWGGHLSYGSSIFTTAEIVFAQLDQQILKREFDPDTGYDELVVYPNKDS